MEDDERLVRLQVAMARAGVASRRAAEQLIAAGRVEVNGQIVTQAGTKVNLEHDRIVVNGRPLSFAERFVYLAINKPVGYVSTVADPGRRPTVLDLVPDNLGRLYPVGRLDIDSEGLLIISNDGEFTHKLTHPSRGIDKEYLVRVEGNLSEDDLHQLRRGVVLDGVPARAESVQLANRHQETDSLRIILREGRKRQVRRMLLAVGHRTLWLRRVRIGPITLGELPLGQYRHLTERELRAVRQA